MFVLEGFRTVSGTRYRKVGEATYQRLSEIPFDVLQTEFPVPTPDELFTLPEGGQITVGQSAVFVAPRGGNIITTPVAAVFG